MLAKKPKPTAAKWKTAQEARRISFSSIIDRKSKQKKLVRIGGNSFGDVFAGRLRFRDCAVHAVAIKIFHNPISEQKAMQYQQVINELRAAGVRIPKMAMLKLSEGSFAGQWVQVSQLFGSAKKGTKLAHTGFSTREKSSRTEAVIEFTKIANCGFALSADSLESFKQRSKGVIPIDLDGLVKHGRQSPESAAFELVYLIRDMTESPEEKERLFRTALRHATPELRKCLLREKTHLLFFA